MDSFGPTSINFDIPISIGEWTSFWKTLNVYVTGSSLGFSTLI